MASRLILVNETWQIYALRPRDWHHDVALRVTTYLAGKRSERAPAHYERAWKRYLLAQQAVTSHPAFAAAGPRHSEPRVLYDPIADDVYWLFHHEERGITFLVTPRPMPELTALLLPDERPFAVHVRAPAYAADDAQEQAS